MSNTNHQLSTHILPTASTMVGVCMTVISIVKLTQVSRGESWMDELLALDSLVFLASALLSYFSLRANRISSNSADGERFERWADTTFICGLILMGFAAIAITLEIL